MSGRPATQHEDSVGVPARASDARTVRVRRGILFSGDPDQGESSNQRSVKQPTDLVRTVVIASHARAAARSSLRPAVVSQGRGVGTGHDGNSDVVAGGGQHLDCARRTVECTCGGVGVHHHEQLVAIVWR